jgi:hypothetical protein
MKPWWQSSDCRRYVYRNSKSSFTPHIHHLFELYSNGLSFQRCSVDKALPPLDEAYHLIFDPVGTKLETVAPEQNDWLAEPTAPGPHWTFWKEHGPVPIISWSKNRSWLIRNNWTGNVSVPTPILNLTTGYISSNSNSSIKSNSITIITTLLSKRHN